MFDVSHISPIEDTGYEWIDGEYRSVRWLPSNFLPENGSESGSNVRLVALNDKQLGTLLSALSFADILDNWIMQYAMFGTTVAVVPDSPFGVGWDSLGGREQGSVRLTSLPPVLNGALVQNVVAFLAELREQLMVDVRPELQAMVEAQNEMSDDLDAIRVSLQEIAANIEAENNSERLEEIANTIGLLVALL